MVCKHPHIKYTGVGDINKCLLCKKTFKGGWCGRSVILSSNYNYFREDGSFFGERLRFLLTH